MRCLSLVVCGVLLTLCVAKTGCCQQPNDVHMVLSIKDDAIPDRRSYEVRFYKNNQIIAEQVFRAGKLIDSEGTIPDGVISENYEDGNIRSLITFSGGERNGPFWSFYESGQLKGTGFYKDNIPDGMGKIYYENGNLKAEWEMIDGLEYNRVDYDEDGTRMTR